MAVMVAVPVAMVVTVPAETVAILLLDDVHVAVEVTSEVLPFTVVPEAVKVTVWPVAARRDTGEMVMLAIESPDVKKPGHPLSSIRETTAIANAPR